MHAAPDRPHAASVTPGLQTSPSQQPSGHEAGVHRHASDWHSWPAAHAGPVPHTQVPALLHALARSGSQRTQTPPSFPHVSSDRVLHEPEQQPSGQVRAVQLEQDPSKEHFLLPSVHSSQEPPPLPQALPALPARQAEGVPPQHPGQVSGSHTHWPASQRSPTPHCALGPQRQEPSVPQAFARLGSQAEHIPPAVPHVARLAGWQTPCAQQPPAQLVAVQMQLPELQLNPCTQAAAPPQPQVPSDRHSSPTPVQSRQVPPPGPQCSFDGVRQTPDPSQQPEGQLVASQTHFPRSHRWPASQTGPWPQTQVPVVPEQPLARGDTVQSEQEPPSSPHVAGESGWHAPSLQQPLGQELASQTHCDPAQRVPAGQSAPPPQVQTPWAEHPSARGPHATHATPAAAQRSAVRVRQVAPEQQPVLQVEALQEVQDPVRQLSVAGQGLHAWPPLPHAVSSRPVRQVPETSQQPVHEAVVQRQRPARHSWPEAQVGPVPHPASAPAPASSPDCPASGPGAEASATAPSTCAASATDDPASSPASAPAEDGASESATATSRPRSTTAASRAWATTPPAESPSTSTSTDRPPRASGRRMRSVCSPVSAPAADSGRTAGSKSARPSSVAEKRSCSTGTPPRSTFTSRAVPTEFPQEAVRSASETKTRRCMKQGS